MESDIPRALIDKSMLLISGPRHGYSVRKRQGISGSYRAPKAAYLIYIGLQDEELVIRHMYRYPIDHQEIDTVEKQLFQAAASGPGTGEEIGTNFRDIRFETQSYFSVVADIGGWSFYFPEPDEEEPIPGETHDPLVFVERKTTLGLPKAANYAFFNARETRIERKDGKVRNGIRFTNYMTKEDGKIIGGDGKTESKHYCFEIYLRVPFAKTGTERDITLIIDPDGENQGPPK